MPELPEVETTRRGLVPVLKGRRLAAVEVRRPDLRFPLPCDFASRLEGRRVVELGRRAKYVLATLDDGMVWLVHLGMSGRLQIDPAPSPRDRPPGKHDHVVVLTESGDRITYTDARRFGFMDLIPAGELDGHPRLAALGVEPLGSELDGARLADLFRGRGTSAKAALLDQRLVAGIGNIYACEALWRAGVSPLRKAGSLSRAECDRLAAAVKAVLEEAILAGGSSLRDYVQTTGELGYFQHAWSVYGREGEPCRRDVAHAVARMAQNGRSTFYCPACQS